MSDIVEGRKQLRSLADRMLQRGHRNFAAQIRGIIDDYLIRKQPTRKARMKSRAVTDEVREEILSLADENPDMHLSEIAARVGVNPGRVSEVLNGKR